MPDKITLYLNLPAGISLSFIPNVSSGQNSSSFSLGRSAARKALDKFIPNFSCEIPRAENRSAIWPTGFTGSIAHTENTAISIVGRTSEFKGLGVDLENKDRSLSIRMSETFSQKLPEELNLEVPSALIIFCLKEALFKAASNAQVLIPSFREIEFDDFDCSNSQSLQAKFHFENYLFLLNAITYGDYLITSAYLRI